MAKIQKILRKNGSEVYSVNIPLDIVETKGWQKGDELVFNEIENNRIEISKTD